MSETSWRRSWRPDLSVQPWRPLTSDDDSTFLIKSLFKDNYYELLMTDLTAAWYERLEGEEITARVEVR